MRLGVTLPFEDSQAGETVRLASRAESLGYEDAWSYERDYFDAFTPLATVASATQQMRLGTSIVPALTRPPALIAMSAASLAHLAPGRFRLGLGASTETVVNGWMGLDWSQPITRTSDALISVRRLLAGDKVGRFRLYRPPVTPVPIYLAALGPRMLKLAGELADGVVLFMAGPNAIPDVQRICARPIDTVARVVTVTGSSVAASRDFARRFIAMYTSLPFYSAFLSRQGFGDEVAAIGARWRSGDRRAAARLVSDAMVRDLVWIVADENAADLVVRFAEAGLGCMDLWFMSPADSADQRQRDLERALTECHELAGKPAPAASR